MNNQDFYLLRFLAVIKHLREELQLKFLILKGPVYSLYFPGETHYSRFTDLDIYPLEDPKEFARKLNASGRFLSQIPIDQNNFLAIDEVQWLDTQSGLILDVHAGVFRPYLGKRGNVLDNQLVNKTETISLNNVQCQVLPKDHFLLHLLLHGEKHYWEFIKDKKLARIAFGNEENQRLLSILVGEFNLDNLYTSSLLLLDNKSGNNKAANYLKHLENEAYPKTMFQLWRIRNLCYHFQVSANWNMFFTRISNGILPVLPLAVFTYPGAGVSKLKLIHLFRMLGFVPQYRENATWQKAIDVFYKDSSIE